MSYLNKCFFNKSQKCADWPKRKEDGLYNLKELNSEVTAPFICQQKFLEKDLIKNRANLDDDLIEICAYHRYSLGLDWKAPEICLHPDHKPGFISKSLQSVAFSDYIYILGQHKIGLRTASYDMWNKMIFNFKNFPIGGKICTYHRKNYKPEQDDNESSSSEEEHQENEIEYDMKENVSFDKRDEESREAAIKSMEKLDELCLLLDVPKVAFHCSKENSEEYSKRTHQYKNQKLNEILERAEKVFMEGFFIFERKIIKKPKKVEIISKTNVDELKDFIEGFQQCKSGNISNMVFKLDITIIQTCFSAKSFTVFINYPC